MNTGRVVQKHEIVPGVYGRVKVYEHVVGENGVYVGWLRDETIMATKA